MPARVIRRAPHVLASWQQDPGPAEVFDLMTVWIERYRQQADDRYRCLDEVLASLPDDPDTEPGPPSGDAP